MKQTTRHRTFTLREFIVILAVLIGLTIILWPSGAGRSRENARRTSCQSNLKQINLAFAQYVRDTDTFPALTLEIGWVGALQPYLANPKVFQCPSERVRGPANLTDYWFNRRLVGAERGQLALPAQTFLSGDGGASDDPNISLALLPPLWRQTEDSPARRHLDMANYLFADGHVKSLKPQFVTARKPDAKTFTFLPR